MIIWQNQDNFKPEMRNDGKKLFEPLYGAEHLNIV